MSEDDANDGGLEAGLRWIAQQVGRSVEQLEDLDLEAIARAAGVDAERAREYLDSAGQWLTEHADALTSEAILRFGGLADVVNQAQASASGSRVGPHPLDMPTPGQGLALSAVDSGRWTVEPGSHVIAGTGEGPAPADAEGLVGELRARDWINAGGELTLVGRKALTRWMDSSSDAG